jgi:hypothetical protein
VTLSLKIDAANLISSAPLSLPALYVNDDVEWKGQKAIEKKVAVDQDLKNISQSKTL